MQSVRGMICLLHGYLLDGSGSNLWTRSIARALVRDGATIHLVCQEPHPEQYDFINEAYEYATDGTVEKVLDRETEYTGRCIMHQPLLGDTLPVYVWDAYEEFEHVVPMTELGVDELEDYLHRNVEVVARVVRENGITVMHANHALLMTVVAQRVSAWTGVPYAVMPHGSALEYAVKPDARLRRLAAEAFEHADRVLVISDETAQRAVAAFGDSVTDLEAKLSRLDLGVDTAAFQPIERSERAANIERVGALLETVARGRTPEQSAALKRALANGSVADACDAVGAYTAKNPDADVEAKLASIDWATDQVLAFVGRLIPAKGIHAVIAALPLMLARAPRLRLVVVGHGPLREPLEAFVHALAHGDRSLAGAVLDHAATIEAGEPEHLRAVNIFWESLRENGELETYWAAAERYMKPDTVIFTGYLTHREMAWLLPCCDAAVFPSMVIESGPLVFLEALASGVFPIGTYFGGMKVKIDRAAPALDEAHRALMKVRPDADHITADIAATVPAALDVAGRYRRQLRAVADEHYDWRPIARRLRMLLEDVGEAAKASGPV
ncbi:MAG TPA: glycosyltransferase [Longimicrobiales bacterium]|nr:glycosyltransferase [Longimicrobiales bacterium]